MYEPTLNADSFYNSRVISDFGEFKEMADVIVANRLSAELKDREDKVYPGICLAKIKGKRRNALRLESE